MPSLWTATDDAKLATWMRGQDFAEQYRSERDWHAAAMAEARAENSQLRDQRDALAVLVAALAFALIVVALAGVR